MEKNIPILRKTKNKIPIKKGSTIAFHTLIGDVQGCGNIRVIFPSLLLNNFISESKFKYNCMASYGPWYNDDPNFYKRLTFLQFQRGCSEQHLNMLVHFKTRHAAASGTPLIYEVDDLLFDIPEWNYASKFFNSNKKNIEKILSISDGMVVSTQKLKKIYSKYNENITVQPNHLPKFLWDERLPRNYMAGTKMTILYPGSQNHFKHKAFKGKDGGDISEEILEYIRKTVDDYNWVFVGGIPLSLEDLSKEGKIQHIDWINILHYPRKIRKIVSDFKLKGPVVGIAPLEDNKFNSCKSNIKMLEYSALSIPGVYFDIEPYKNATLKFKTAEQFIGHIEELNDNSELFHDVIDKDYETVKDQLYWEENDNIWNYVNRYMNILGKKLEK